jgi:hypothetical protein
MAIPGGMVRATQVLAVCVAVAVLGRGGEMVAADEAALPRGDERVKSVWLFDVASDLPFCADAAIADSQGLFVAGHSWREVDGERLWLWRIDREGNRLWEKELARPKVAESLKLVALLPGENEKGSVGAEHEITIVTSCGLKTAARTCNLRGELSDELVLDEKNGATGAVRLADGDLLVFGSETARSLAPSPCWAARFGRSGEERWRLKLDPTVDAKRIVPWARKLMSPGQYHVDFLQAGAETHDGSAVLVGVTGDVNKFGQGPSNLWLVRVSGDGKQLAQTLVKDGRFFGGVKDLIVRRGNDVLVPYTTAQLPSIGNVPLDAAPSFGGRLACFDSTLAMLWEKPLPDSAMPGAVAICGSGPYAMLSASADDVLVQALDDDGEELWESKVEAPDSSVFPVSLVRRESGVGDQVSGEIVAVCNYLRHQARNEKVRPGTQVMVFTVK